MAVLTIACAIVALVALISLWMWRKSPPFPGPVNWFLIANLLRVRQHATRRCVYFGELLEYYKADTISLSIMWRTLVVTRDPEIIKHILVTKFDKVYEKPKPSIESLAPLFGQGIFAANGDNWRYQRSTAQPYFNWMHLGDMVPTFSVYATKGMERLKAQRKSASTPVNMQDIYFRYTLDSFGHIGFGTDLKALEEDENEFAKHFDAAQLICAKRVITYPAWKFTGEYQAELDAHVKYLNSYVTSIIQQKREAVKTNGLEITADSDMILRFMVDTEANDEYLRDVVLNFAVAGRDTTATLLSYATWILGNHQDAQQKVYDEIIQVIGEDAREVVRSGSLTIDHLKGLDYLMKVLKESLRLYPPVPADGFGCVHPNGDVLPGGQKIACGTAVIYDTWAIGRYKKLWGEDAEEFRPSRWDEPGIPKPFSYVPFHGGPRVCLGQDMAYLEAKAMLVFLIVSYSWTVPKDYELEVWHSLLMPPRDPVRVLLQERE